MVLHVRIIDGQFSLVEQQNRNPQSASCIYNCVDLGATSPFYLLESIFPTFVDCNVEICEKICLNLFFILFVHPHATQCIGMMTDVKMSVEKRVLRQNFFLMCKGVIHFNANVFDNVNIANIYQVNIHRIS